LLEVILDSSAIVFLIELDNIELGGDSLDGFLCATAVSCKNGQTKSDGQLLRQHKRRCNNLRQ
jgi:hypothetical protein